MTATAWGCSLFLASHSHCNTSPTEADLTASGAFSKTTATRHITGYMHIQLLCDCYNGIPHRQFAESSGKVMCRALQEMKSRKSSPTGHLQNIHPTKISVHTVCIACVVHVYNYIYYNILINVYVQCKLQFIYLYILLSVLLCTTRESWHATAMNMARYIAVTMYIISGSSEANLSDFV